MAEDERAVIGSRRGWSFRRRLAALDSYGLLLLLILLSLIVSALNTADLGRLSALIRIVTLGGTLAFALHTSGASRRTYVVCSGMVFVAIGLSLSFDAASRAGRAIAAASAFALIAAVLATILRRFAVHLRVTGASILAAISVYLLVGLAYATIYGFVGAVGSADLFSGGAGDGTSAERIYFSYITLTTVGYGDFTMGADLGRMIAATEGLLGQVYLVTVVALLVSNLGATRRRSDARGPDPPSDGR